MADGLTKVRADTILMRMVLEGQEDGIKEENDILKDKAVVKAKHQKERAAQIQALKDTMEPKQGQVAEAGVVEVI